jgi:hypothetical protein
LSIKTELQTLFTRSVIRQSKRLKPDRVDALAVQAAAGALLRLKGQPTKQVELVQAMRPDTAAALCRWLADPSFWSAVAGITTH